MLTSVVTSFGGEVLDSEILASGNWQSLDMKGFMVRNSKDARRDEIFSCAKVLRSQYKRIGVIGFCFGGWAVFQLGAKGNGLVDCIATAHPSLLTKEEIDAVGVPVQILAPEHDMMFTPELREYANKKIPELQLPYDFQFFPGVVHGFAARGKQDDVVERKAMIRAKNAIVAWLRLWLHD